MNFKKKNGRFDSLSDSPKTNYYQKKTYNSKKKEYNFRPQAKKEEKGSFDLENDFPEINDPAISEKPASSSCENLNYLEKCNLKKEEDLKNLKIREGWLCLKYDKATKKTSYSRNGIDFVDNHENIFSEQEKNEKIQKQREKNIREAENKTNELLNRWERDSQLHYEVYGELDGYALAQIEFEKYQKYAEQFEELLEEEEIYYDSEEYYSD